MSVDDGLPAKAIVSKTSSASEGTPSRQSQSAMGQAVRPSLLSSRCSWHWVAALGYGVHRAVEVIG